jgi:acetoin utilization protein AcuB
VLDASIASLMSSDLLSVSPETDVTEVVDLMIEHRVGAIPVVGDEGDDLLGIISYVDILRAARDLF